MAMFFDCSLDAIRQSPWVTASVGSPRVGTRDDGSHHMNAHTTNGTVFCSSGRLHRMTSLRPQTLAQWLDSTTARFRGGGEPTTGNGKS